MGHASVDKPIESAGHPKSQDQKRCLERHCRKMKTKHAIQLNMKPYTYQTRQKKVGD